MKTRIFLTAMLAVAATAIGIADGAHSTLFQMAVAMSLANLAVMILPKLSLGLPAGMVAADDDPAAMLDGLVKDLKTTKTDLEKQQRELKDAHRETMDKLEKGIKLDPEVQKNIDTAITKANESSLQSVELAQKVADLVKSIGERANQGPMTIRSAIVKSLEGENKEAYESLVKHESNKLRVVLKEITSADVSTGMKREPHIDSLVSMERRPLRIRDLLTVVPVQSDSVKYGKQTVRDNRARIVAEGTKKPYSNYKWESATATIETIAHLAKLTLQALADAPRLAAEVESEMVYGYRLAEENEILNGDGTTNHLSGLIENATAYSVPAGVDTGNVLNPVDRLRIAILQIHLAFATPDGHVLNPVDLANIELLRRDPDKGGGYIYGNPDSDTGIARLWRLPVVESPSMAVGRFLTGAFKYSAHLYDRQGVTVAISTENDTDFEDNLATMRVEGRLGLGVRRSYGLVEGPLSGSGS